MSTAETLTLVDVEKILAQWAVNGPTRAEQDQFIATVIQDLNDPQKVGGFQRNIEEVGIWANEVDAAFDRVSRSMEDIFQRYGSTFPELARFRDDWNGYNRRWVTHLLLSRDVASEHVSILRRFDQVFLDMVEHIQSDQDRLDVIVELQKFIDEDHASSDRMAEGFFALKNDITNFVERFDAYVEQKGAELHEQAVSLRREIDGVMKEIVSLNLQIFSATAALLGTVVAGTATLIGLLGVVAAAAVLVFLLAERVSAEVRLARTRQALAVVNAQQQALARLKGDFDGLKPDINLICERLVMFGEIWQSVRTESIRFQTHLKLGMDAVSDARFRQEVRLARDTCGPLQAGLEKYAAQLGTRGKRE